MTIPPLPPKQHDRCALMLSHRLTSVTLDNFASARATMGATHDVFLALTEPLAEEAIGLGLAGQFVVLAPDAIFEPAYGAKSASRRIVPGNPDLVMLAFWRMRPEYSAYWLLEYDVLMPQGYEPLAEICARTDADLIASRIRTYVDRPDWGHWRTLAAPDGPVPEERRHGSYMPLSRFSAVLMRELDRAFRAGWRGHHECVVATIARHAGLTVADLNNAAQAALGRPLTTPFSFRVKDCQATKPEYAHHPVKTSEEAQAIRAALGLPETVPSAAATLATQQTPVAAPPAPFARLELLATVEEMAAQLSLVHVHLDGADPAMQAMLTRVQGDLAELATALDDAPKRFGEGRAIRLEIELGKLRPHAGPQKFVPPTGGLAASHAFMAGAIARRAGLLARRLPGGAGDTSANLLRYLTLLPEHLHALAGHLAERQRHDGAEAAPARLS